jgi:hypothetical protein
MISSDSLLETGTLQPSALEAETAASLLDFARVVMPPTSLGKRPVSDSDTTTDIAQPKKQRH